MVSVLAMLEAGGADESVVAGAAAVSLAANCSEGNLGADDATAVVSWLPPLK